MTAALPRSFAALTALMVGLMAASLLPFVTGHFTKKTVAIAVGSLAALLLAMATHEVKAMLLVAWTAGLSYYRTYFVNAFGDHGGSGTYVMVADAALAGLFVWWLWERVVLKRSATPHGPALWVLWTPFALVFLASALAAPDPSLAMTDVVRVLKFGLLLWYMRYHVGRKEWWWIVGALGLVVVGQSLFGVVQVATGRLAPGGFDAGEYRRATGTMVHANILAPYLVAAVPVFLALAAMAPTKLLRLVSLGVAVTGAVGIGCTMSRAPWVLLALEAVAVFAGLAVFRVIRVQQAVALVCLSVLAGGLALLPFADKLHERMVGNLGESVAFRIQLNVAALNMFDASPVLGIGPNHFTSRLPEVDPSFSTAVEFVQAAEEMYSRTIAGVHNLYLLILAETGAAGLAMLLVFLAGVVRAGAVAVRGTTGAVRGACFGMLVGLLAVLLEEMTDFSLWMDPSLYTLAVVAGLLNNAPTLWAGRERA